MHNNHYFDVKLALDFFDAELIICFTFSCVPGEGLTWVIGFKIWPWI